MVFRALLASDRRFVVRSEGLSAVRLLLADDRHKSAASRRRRADRNSAQSGFRTTRLKSNQIHQRTFDVRSLSFWLVSRRRDSLPWLVALWMTRVRLSVLLGPLTGLPRMSRLLPTRRLLLPAILLMHHLLLRPMRTKLHHASLLALVLAACAVPTHSVEHSIVVGGGGAVEVELPKGKAQTGTNVFVEYHAIENWLELELGVSFFP